MTGCRTECHSLAHNEPAVQEVKVYLHHCQQPLQFYRELRAQGVRAVRFIPQLRAEDANAWGNFLCAIFHIWAREDIGRITITLFEETLRIWCGEPLREQRQLAANSACFVCAWRRYAQATTIRSVKATASSMSPARPVCGSCAICVNSSGHRAN